MTNGSGKWRGTGKEGVSRPFGHAPATPNCLLLPRGLCLVGRVLLQRVGDLEPRLQGVLTPTNFCSSEPAPGVESWSQRSWSSRLGKLVLPQIIAGARPAFWNAGGALGFPPVYITRARFFSSRPLSRESVSSTKLRPSWVPAPTLPCSALARDGGGTGSASLPRRSSGKRGGAVAN